MKYSIFFALFCLLLAPFALADAHEETCRVVVAAQNTQEFIQEIPSLNERLQECPLKVPAAANFVVGGMTVIDIVGDTNATFTVDVTQKRLRSIVLGNETCSQKAIIQESDFDAFLTSTDRGQALLDAYDAKLITVQGCTFMKKITIGVASMVARWFI